MPSLHTHLRIYCERSNDTLLGEPLNAVSNIGFFIAAWLLWRIYRHHRPKIVASPDIPVLIMLTAIMGAGSMIFHSVATFGAMFFDIIPILCFALLYVYIFARTLLEWNRLLSALLFFLLINVNLVYKYYVIRAIDGYVSYIPTFLFLFGLALWMFYHRHPSARTIALATGMAFVALYFRTMDRIWCHAFPLGTHFLWHGFTALSVYLLVREVILYRYRLQPEVK